MKKISLIFIGIIIFTLLIIPNIVNADEERVDYQVTILPGNGTIQKSLDKCTEDNYYVYCNKDEFESIDSINISVRENENIKNRLDYSSEGLFVNSYNWANESYITDTKIVEKILENGIDTRHSNNNGTFGGTAYSTNCEKIYLFIPPEGKYFSNFIDQDGNSFSIGDTVTKDLILTPVYVDEQSKATLAGKEIHSVTFTKGEGKIEYKIGWGEDSEEIDSFTVWTFDGETNFYDIPAEYAIFKYSDYEKGIIALQEGKEEIVSLVQNGDIDRAKERFDELIDYSLNDLFFTIELSITTDNESLSQYIREHSMAFGVLLDIWIEYFGEGDCSLENVENIVATFEKYDELTEEEKEEAVNKLVTTLNAFDEIWNEYIYEDIYHDLDFNLAFYSIYAENRV